VDNNGSSSGAASDRFLTFDMASTPTNFNVPRSTGNLYIGQRADGTQRFNGYLDEVRLSAGLLNDEDLLGKVAADYTYTPTTPACGAHRTESASMGTISDGTAADTEYANGMACEWLIDHSALNPLLSNADDEMENAFIALTFTRFSTEPRRDVVQVFDGDSADATLLGEFSGYDVPMVPLLSTGPRMLVRFRTDAQQTLPQMGWAAKFTRISLPHTKCASVNEGHNLSLACQGGYKISKVNFASYGTPTGFCSNGAGEGVGTLTDSDGFQFAENSNPQGVTDGAAAGAGAGGSDGPILFGTGFCHSGNSRSVVETACVGKRDCALQVNDLTFGGSPCDGITDSKQGSMGTDDADVLGTDPSPRSGMPYSGNISKRLFVQVRERSVGAWMRAGAGAGA
jgi:hypothetical protein